MKAEIVAIVQDRIDRYVRTPDLNGLMKEFALAKAAEKSKWAEVTIRVHRMLRGDFAEIDAAGAAVEMVLLALDIMDDLQDLDNVGKPWMQCPREYALNAVMSFIMIASGELGRLQELMPGRFPLGAEAAGLIASSVNGQQRDLNGSVRTEDDYFGMIREKSGSLMRFAFLVGGAFAGLADDQTWTRLNELAECHAAVAQLDNDLQDILRFDVKNDLLNRQRTLPILFLLETSPVDFPPLSQYYEGEITREEFARHREACIRYANDSGCVEYVQVVQALFRQRAEELLDGIDGDPACIAKLKEMIAGE